MSSAKRYKFEELWFETYLRVRRLNADLQENGLDQSQLREITTSIFIAKTHRGIVRPQQLSPFQESVVHLLEAVTERAQQKMVYKELEALLEDQQLTTQTNGAEE